MDKIYNGNNEINIGKSKLSISLIGTLKAFFKTHLKQLQLDPIDCTDDPCHLAWLIRDNPNLLRYVKYGECSNGTLFENLNPFGFENCFILDNLP